MIIFITFLLYSLCTASTDKQLCHLAAGFEDSTIVLWSINGFDNYGHRPYQKYDDRQCQWSINNCNRMLTDDLSDYTTSDDEVERNLKESEGWEEDESVDLRNESQRKIYSVRKRKMTNRGKYQRALSIREQWEDYTAKSCTENIL